MRVDRRAGEERDEYANWHCVLRIFMSDGATVREKTHGCASTSRVGAADELICRDPNPRPDRRSLSSSPPTGRITPRDSGRGGLRDHQGACSMSSRTRRRARKLRSQAHPRRRADIRFAVLLVVLLVGLMKDAPADLLDVARVVTCQGE
jgi:hypothetical protein